LKNELEKDERDTKNDEDIFQDLKYLERRQKSEVSSPPHIYRRALHR
jgi:hypothetical protein